MTVEFKPFYERGWKASEDETPQGYDIYVGGQWLGSRRTIPQCEQEVRNHAR